MPPTVVPRFASTTPRGRRLRDQSGVFGQLGSNPRVDGDYAWLGNQTNIGANNNKFYRGQVVTNDHGQYFSWTRWGRVGVPGQSNLDGPTDQASAVKAFTAKFKAKSSFAWSGGDFSYPECKPTKYVIVWGLSAPPPTTSPPPSPTCMCPSSAR